MANLHERSGSTVIAVSLKMYFDYHQTLRWSRKIREVLSQSPHMLNGATRVIIFPTFPSIPAVVELFEDTPVEVGAQNVSHVAHGAFTGEVDINTLTQVGCSVIEIGHAERRRYFYETTEQTRSKLRLTRSSGLTPLLCVGEDKYTYPKQAARECIALINKVAGEVTGPLIIAYEPEWAIGAKHPADTNHVRHVCSAIRKWIADQPSLAGSSIIYCGSAQPGLLQN